VPTIGVVSDTHLPRFGRRLPRALLDGLAAHGLSRILHAGDHPANFVVDALSELAPVEAVAGNNDPPDLIERFGTRRTIDIGGVRIGLTHGHLGRGRTTLDRALGTFADEGVTIVVFGHSHQPLWRPPSGDRPGLLNPGSPTDRRREASFTYAILDVEPEGASARIVSFADRSP
jgi:putative phosphoesterase